MNGIYNLNELAMMTGFTTRTLRNYLTQGLLKGAKNNGTWQFTAEEVEDFFNEPFVRESLRIKRNSIVYDFLADHSKKTARTCTILDIPASLAKGNSISAFFCEQMKTASDTVFTYDWHKSSCRVILSGTEDQIARILKAYFGQTFTDK